MKESLV